MLNAGRDTKVDVRQAMEMFASAWSEVKVSTVSKCWIHSGFIETKSQEDYVDTGGASTPCDVWQFLTGRINLDKNINFEDYITADDDVLVCEDLTDARILEQVSSQQAEADDLDSSDDDDDFDQEVQEEKITFAASMDSLKTLKKFLANGDEATEKLLALISKLEHYLIARQAQQIVQRKITDYI